MKRNQKGFTLVELAIVLVIIGLLLGAILKGQELITGGKVKSLEADFHNIPASYYGYQDKYHAIPGDDQTLGPAALAPPGTHLLTATRATSPAGVTLGNAHINGTWRSATLTDESMLVWQHMRLGGFMNGSTVVANTADYLPTNAVRGLMGITSDNPTNVAAFTATSFYLCSDGIDGELAQQLDTAMDDGNGQTGSMRAMAVGTLTNGATIAYTPGVLVVVCMAN